MAEGVGNTPGQQTVDFSLLVKRTAEDAFSSLRELAGIAQEQSDSERKLSLLKNFLRTRQRLLRVLSLSKWCRQIPLVERCQQLSGTVSNHDTSFTQAADFLFFLHEGLQQARAPIYDIPTAAEVLLTGQYNRLPKCIEELGMQPMLAGEEREEALQKLDTMLRSRLLDISLPKEISDITVSEGRIILQVDGEFKVQLTAGYRGHLHLWRILHLELLVGESTGPTKFTDHQRLALGDDLERRMAASDDPFRILFSILHEFCTTLVMDTLFRQTGMLRQGRWKDAIRFEKISEASNISQGVGIGQGTGQGPGPPGDSDPERVGAKSRGSPGLRIWYWLDCPKGISGVDPNSPPHLRIEPGPDQHIVCSHQPSVIDPTTESEAEFSIDQSCIDVERLLLRAIACNIHTRLLEVQRGLKGSNQLWRVDCDVVLRSSFSEDGEVKSSPSPDENNSSGSSGEAGEEVLCVRAYGDSFMALGISIRNGRFLIRSPSTLLANSVLAEMEDALNQGSKDPVDIFLNLRSRSLLHVFASLGTNFNLKIYERGALALKFPSDGPKLGPDVLVLGFPNCGEVYFLSLHLDSNFMPFFMLLEAQPRTLSGRSTFSSGPINIIRCMKVNIETMLVTEDDASFSLLDEGRLELERQTISAVNVSKKGTGKELMEFVGKKTEVSVLDSRGFGRSLTGGTVLESVQTELTGEKFYRGSPAAHLSRTNNPLSPSFSPIQSPSGLQGMAASNPQYAGSNIINQGPNAGFSPGNSSLAASSLLQSNHRVGRIGNGIMASPARSPLHRGVTSLKSPYQGEQDVLQSKSPLHAGESAASPIDLDYDDISKLIDSISSKTPGVPPGASHTSPAGEPVPLASRQPRVGLTRSLPMVKSPAMNPRTPQTKSSSLQGLSSGRVSGQTATVLARLSSPRKPLGSQAGELAAEWMDLDQSSQAVQSPSMLLSPSTRPATGVQGHSYNRGPQSSEKLPSDFFKRKRSGPELLFSLPSIQAVATSGEKVKRRKTEQEGSQSLVGQLADVTSFRTLPVLDSFVGQPYSTIVVAANQGKAPMGSYTAVLLQVVRRCWLCIKHARLTRQMDALNIPYVEEVGLRKPSSNLRFRLPSREANRDSKKYDSAGWQQICLCLGKPGSDGWEVEVQDAHFKALWELQLQKPSSWGSGVQFATLPEEDSHISCTQKGLVLRYSAVEDDSVKKLVADLERLWSARMFAVGIRKLLEEKVEERAEGAQEKGEGEQDKGPRIHGRGRFSIGERSEGGEKKWEVMRRAFRVEAVGLTSTWFTYVGSLPGVMARFVVEWEAGNRGCTVHVSPEQLWPHTKYLEDYINGGEVELLLDSIRVSVGPLQALAAAIRPARMLGPATSAVIPSGSVQGVINSGLASKPTGGGLLLGQVSSPIPSSTTTASAIAQARLPNGSTSVLNMGNTGTNMQGSQAAGLASGPGRPIIPGLVPSSLLPTDVSVLLRTPFWIRIVYRRQFAMDMRCFAGDQVWLQPAPPPRSGGTSAGGSLPCPQFRPFVMEHVAIGLQTGETVSGAGPPGNLSGNGVSQTGFGPGMSAGWGGGMNATAPSLRGNSSSMIGPRMVNNAIVMAPRGGTLQGGPSNSSVMAVNTGRVLNNGPSAGLRSEYTAIFGLGDDGGYGGAWVPLAALKKVLRGILRYLGVLWLFAQFPTILREVLGEILKENEGALLNHDPEQPALRFYIGNCVFAVSMHRQQLYLQAINVKKFQQQQNAHAQGQSGGPDNELSDPEMAEIGDFFARRVASEPYDASRLASFVTMLTLPIPTLREFLKLIAWEKELQKASANQSQGGDGTQTSRPKIELCLENRVGSAFSPVQEEAGAQGTSSTAKSSIRHIRAQNIVEFTLTLYLDGHQLPPINVAGGAGWLPQCVAVRLSYQFSEPSRLSVVNVEGSHGGRACWVRQEDWEHSKVVITNAVDHYVPGNDQGLGRLQPVAELVQRTVQQAVLSLRKGGLNAPSPMASPYAS
ncbi:mediator of RNA polymerase II transcription subunit 14 [Marchantia polymorpha subsp. ruderalis]|nr:hypothetical protein MARPO_0110s0011 [Marchantia polymorpha]BBN19751.1 hypothetical protein Mp_8g13300 [Marchantia polymorpha subsp. ruderalis]|eukprot:PTQ31518.1 hypothetical protein MARPO_0110s0011 [Marchantia polymorpha]